MSNDPARIAVHHPTLALTLSPLRRLLGYFGRHKTALALGSLCVAASATFSLLKPLIIGNAVNELAKAVTRGALVRYGLLLVGAAVAAEPDGGLRDVADAVDVIARRSAGLMSFVERYRTMAELPPPALELLPVEDFIHHIDQLMRPTLESRGVAYSSSVEPPGLTVRADGGLLEQALINLLHNAMEALSAAADPRIELRCQIRDEDCVISVSDNGKGLESGSLEHIFVPFFTTQPGGTGIGLSLARQIAHAHHGRLEAASNEPRGAVFTLSIPQASTLAPR
jgi:signal transduction histidine kinase